MTNPNHAAQMKDLRAAIKKAFPDTRISIRKSTTASLRARITWTDGPTAEQVNEILKPFYGWKFDSYTDLDEPIKGAKYDFHSINVERFISDEFAHAALKVAHLTNTGDVLVRFPHENNGSTPPRRVLGVRDGFDTYGSLARAAARVLPYPIPERVTAECGGIMGGQDLRNPVDVAAFATA